MKESNYKISYTYPGGYDALNSEYGSVFTGYRIPHSTMGLSLDPRTANFLKDFSDKLASGQKSIEVSAVMPEVFDTVPKQQLKEIHQLSKLVGVDVSMHGPLIEASGLSKEGFTEANRESAERQMLQAVERSYDLNPDGNIPVTFHSSAMLPATEYVKTDKGEETVRLFAIEKESGQIVPVKKEERYYPEVENGQVIKHVHTPEEQIDIINNTKWSDSFTELILPLDRTDVMIRETAPIAEKVQEKIVKGLELTEPEVEIFQRYRDAHTQLEDMQKHLSSLFHKAYTYGDEEIKNKLNKIAEEFDNKVYIRDENTNKKLGINPDARVFSGALKNLRNELSQHDYKPELYQDLNKYSMDKSGQTFGNVAFESFKKFKENAPIISIENPPAGMNAFSRGEDLKELVIKSRTQFIERAIQPTEKGGLGMSKSNAEKAAEKSIGVTWDVGHINQLKKFGFTDKDLVKESKTVAPYLKHVHLSDNFGMENTELPMGMGNVPLKGMMDALGKKGEEAKKIVEAGNWWQHFRTSPMQFSYESMGSPIYAMQMAPYWNQSPGLEANYFSGYGATLPQINYETFGAGFSQLPAELGGSRQSAGGSRMSGRGME